jgi:hypothetical protein
MFIGDIAVPNNRRLGTSIRFVLIPESGEILIFMEEIISL